MVRNVMCWCLNQWVVAVLSTVCPGLRLRYGSFADMECVSGSRYIHARYLTDSFRVHERLYSSLTLYDIPKYLTWWVL